MQQFVVVAVLVGLTGCEGAAGERGEPGPQGPQGETGATGDPGAMGSAGATGMNGAAIATRPATSAAFDATSTFANVPLANNTWTQAADETDMLIGSIRLTNLGCVDATAPRLFLQYFIDGNFAGEEEILGSYANTTTLSIPGYSGVGTPTFFTSAPLTTIPEPGTSTARTLTLSMRESCSASGHFHVEFVKLKVVRFI